jgi:hypothetical protein
LLVRRHREALPVSAIRWTDDGAASILGWALQRVSTLVPAPKRKLKGAADTEALNFYTTSFQAPLKRRADFRKAAELALPQLMPIKPDDLLIYGRRGPEGVELAAFRRDAMESWWRDSGSRLPSPAVRVSDAWSILPPASEKIAAGRRLAVVIAAVFTVAAAVVFHFAYLSSLNRELSALLAEEEQVRFSALLVARQQEEADLWGSLESDQASARLPGAVLTTVAELSRSTPTEAAWSRIEWSPLRTTMAGTATDPVAVLAALSSVRGAKAEFSKPMTGSGAARQEFEISITYKASPR